MAPHRDGQGGRNCSYAGSGVRAISALAGTYAGDVVHMIFSERDIDLLRLVCWSQYIKPEDLNSLSTKSERDNLAALGLIRLHEKSGAFIITKQGTEFLASLFPGAMPSLAFSYHAHIIQRRLRVAPLLLTAYQGSVKIFTSSIEELFESPSLFLSTITRSRGSNPWGSTRIAAIAHLGDALYAVHYVCPGIGKLALTDELTAFTNQTAQFRSVRRAFIFAGERYPDILAELEQTAKSDTKLISYGDAYRCLQQPVHLLSCDSTGAVQLQIMSVPDYRHRLTQAALKNQYQPPPKDTPAWDALFQGMPFVMAADMDLRRIDAALQTARANGMNQIAIAALRGQTETVLFPRYRDTGLARVFVLTDEAVSTVTGRPPVPYTPQRTQFISPKGDVVDAPPIQTRGKAGGSR